ncbi:hypothetical protein [Sphingosinicella terrae]|uniref:hypothetical protein n=1 Tax=Sphingosinicella terrae TaxID=2172047 RepID=UPI000E0D7DAC|nr:hypothetical protein [Sphingosinicella terrae]
MAIAAPGGLVFALAASLWLAACTRVDLAEPASGRSHVYAGAVSVTIPRTYGELRAIDVSTLGVGADESVFLGWRRGQFVYVRPDECQLLIIIRSSVEAEHATRILQAIEGGQLCVVDFAGSLPSG